MILCNFFFSCSGLAKSVSKVLYVYKYTVPQISISSDFVTESGMDLFYFQLFINNGTDMWVRGWHTADRGEGRPWRMLDHNAGCSNLMGNSVGDYFLGVCN